MVTDKGKKVKMNEENQELGKLVLSFEKVQEIQDELEKINDEQTDKEEQKYNKVRKSIYDKRNDVLKGIPYFWMTALLCHPGVCDYVTEEDQKIFRYLSSIEVEDSKDVKSGYSISFIFNPNPFFENSKLTKTLTFLDEGSTKVTATSIKWKEWMDFPNGVTHDKKGKKRPRVERPHADISFFSWFTTLQESSEEFCDEVAEAIRENLWPNPLIYFNHEVDEIEFDRDEGDEEENGSDGSEDEGDDDKDD